VTFRVLHIVSSRQRRGAEVFASDLVGAAQRLSPETDQRVAVLREEGAVEFGAPTTGLRVERPLGMWAGSLRLRRLHHQLEPDVVQTHGGDALRVAVLAGIGPVVHRRIGAAAPSIRGGARRSWHRLLLRRASLILPVAEHVRLDDIAVFGLDPSRVRTVPNAVDPARVVGPSRAEARASLGIRSEGAVVLSLGSLSWEKDPLRALRATAPRLGPATTHLFVGDGPLAADVGAAATELGVEPWVQVLPARPDVGTVLAAADLLVFSSRADGMEGMPAVLMEAGMAGVAVVATDVAGVGEVVEHCVTGLLAPPDDDGALATDVARLLENPQEREAMGSAAQRRCFDQFRLDVVARAYLAAWREVADRSG
jgi:glycosyltransferase involved in cell wall biosynthesis